MSDRRLLPDPIDRSYSLKFGLALLAVVGIVVASGVRWWSSSPTR